MVRRVLSFNEAVKLNNAVNIVKTLITRFGTFYASLFRTGQKTECTDSGKFPPQVKNVNDKVIILQTV